MMIIDRIDKLQRTLGAFQLAPIVGVIPSALKAVVNAVQIAVGALFSLLLILPSLVSEKARKHLHKAFNFGVIGGCKGLAFSLANICTLTLFAHMQRVRRNHMMARANQNSQFNIYDMSK